MYRENSQHSKDRDYENIEKKKQGIIKIKNPRSLREALEKFSHLFIDEYTEKE